MTFLRVKNILQFLLKDFGPIIGFYFFNFFFGYRISILISIGIVFSEFSYLVYKKEKISAFFYFTSFIVVCFGILDLVLNNQFFFKFEAFFINMFFAGYFASSLYTEKTIIQKFAEEQKRTSLEQSEDKRFFFRLFTIIWVIYFLMKGVFYLWVNFNSSIGNAFFVRVIVGKISFWVIMFFSVGIPRLIWKFLFKLKVFPSQRIKSHHQN